MAEEVKESERSNEKLGKGVGEVIGNRERRTRVGIW